MLREPRLSVIIPTLNRGKLLHDTVEQAVRQAFRDIEVLVVDQSDPEPAAATRSFVADLGDDRVRLVHLDVRGLPNARNEGLARSRAPYVLFLDDDVILLHDTFLDAHLQCFRDPSVGGVVGRIVERTVRPNVAFTANHIGPGGRVITNLWGAERADIGSLKGANMAYRRVAIDKVGGFDRNYTGTALLEDTDFSVRVAAAGWRLLFEPAAELVHLSALHGGVRVEDALRTERWRFRNTGYFVAKNRGPVALARTASTFAGIAAKRALTWRKPSAAVELMACFAEGAKVFRRDGPDQEIPPAPSDGSTQEVG